MRTDGDAITPASFGDYLTGREITKGVDGDAITPASATEYLDECGITMRTDGDVITPASASSSGGQDLSKEAQVEAIIDGCLL